MSRTEGLLSCGGKVYPRVESQQFVSRFTLLGIFFNFFPPAYLLPRRFEMTICFTNWGKGSFNFITKP